MKIVEVNSVPIGSTGKIMFNIGECLEKKGNIVYYAFPEFDAKCPLKYKKSALIIGNKFGLFFAHILGRITGYNDCYNYFSTKYFIKKLKQLGPDVIHIHNLHNCYIDYKLFFEFIKEENIKVIWTLHDCWSFTGGCSYFSKSKCEKWKEECRECKLLSKYPVSYIDKSKELFHRKRTSFTECENMVIVTPSNWLKELVQLSFLKEYQIKTIYNGIDLEVFRVKEKVTGRNDKIKLLGVAFKWDERKGLDTFIQLAEKLDNRYEILLVGIDDKVQQKLPKNIIGVARVDKPDILAEYYRNADIFINPTLEDNFPTTNIEAIACGTPVITYNSGGCAETIQGGVGVIVEKGNINLLIDAINEVYINRASYRTRCLKMREEYDCKKMSRNYMNLFLKNKGEVYGDI